MCCVSPKIHAPLLCCRDENKKLTHGAVGCETPLFGLHLLAQERSPEEILGHTLDEGADVFGFGNNVYILVRGDFNTTKD